MIDPDAIEFETNPDDRCACVLLLDTSWSMNGRFIYELNQGLQAFEQDIKQDNLARRRVEIAIVTFGNGGVQVVQDFVIAGKFQACVLTAGGDTPMGRAINLALDMIRARKEQYKAHDILYYRPWIFMITDGAPTDEWQHAAYRVRAEEAANGVAFFAVGVSSANMQTLAQIAVRPPMKLDEQKFIEMFLWLSRSQGRVSASRPGEMTALPPVGWGEI